MQDEIGNNSTPRVEPYVVDFHGIKLCRLDGQLDENFDDFDIYDHEKALAWLNEQAAKEGA